MVKKRPKCNKRSRSFVVEVEVFKWCEKCGRSRRQVCAGPLGIRLSEFLNCGVSYGNLAIFTVPSSNRFYGNPAQPNAIGILDGRC